MSESQLYNQISSLPEDLRKKVVEYILILKNQSENIPTKETHRISGLAKGMIEMKDNFDDPIDDFNAYM